MSFNISLNTYSWLISTPVSISCNEVFKLIGVVGVNKVILDRLPCSFTTNSRNGCGTGSSVSCNSRGIKSIRVGTYSVGDCVGFIASPGAGEIVEFHCF